MAGGDDLLVSRERFRIDLRFTHRQQDLPNEGNYLTAQPPSPHQLLVSRRKQTSQRGDFFALRNGLVWFRSLQDDICALGKANMRSSSSRRISPNVSFETVPVSV